MRNYKNTKFDNFSKISTSSVENIIQFLHIDELITLLFINKGFQHITYTVFSGATGKNFLNALGVSEEKYNEITSNNSNTSRSEKGKKILNEVEKAVTAPIKGGKTVDRYKSLPISLQDDVLIAKAFITIAHTVYKNLSDPLKKNPKIIQHLMRRSRGGGYKYLRTNLKKRKEYISLALESSACYNLGKIIKEIPKELQPDRDFFFEIIKKNPYRFSGLDNTLKCDWEIAFYMITSAPHLFDDLPKQLKYDGNFLLKVAEVNLQGLLEYSSFPIRKDDRFKRLLVSTFKKNSFNIIKKNPCSITFPSEKLQEDINLILEAAKYDLEILNLLRPQLRNDENFALNLIKINGLYLEFLSDSLKDHEEIVRTAIKISPHSITFASERLQCDKKFILEVAQWNPKILDHLHPSLRKDKNFGLNLIKIDGLHLEFLSDSLKDNKEIVLAAVTQDGWALDHASPRLQSDPVIVKKAVEKDAYAFKFASPELQSNKPFVLFLIKTIPSFLESVIQFINDEEMLKLVKKQNPFIADNPLRKYKKRPRNFLFQEQTDLLELKPPNKRDKGTDASPKSNALS